MSTVHVPSLVAWFPLSRSIPVTFFTHVGPSAAASSAFSYRRAISHRQHPPSCAHRADCSVHCTPIENRSTGTSPPGAPYRPDSRSRSPSGATDAVTFWNRAPAVYASKGKVVVAMGWGAGEASFFYGGGVKDALVGAGAVWVLGNKGVLGSTAPSVPVPKRAASRFSRRFNMAELGRLRGCAAPPAAGAEEGCRLASFWATSELTD